MSKPVIAFDLDGTLIRPNRTIHVRDIEILRTADGPLFIPVTARTLSSVKKLFGQYGLFKDVALPFPLVTQYGSVLFAPHERLVHSECFPSDVAQQLIAAMKAHAAVSSWLYASDGIYTFHSDAFSESVGREFDFVLKPFHDSIGTEFTKALVTAREMFAIERFLNAVRFLNLETAYYQSTILEICPAGVNKGRGLMTLLDELGVSDPVVIAAGDTPQDLTMFKFAYCSYAPLTAHQNVKKAATYILDVEKNGLLGPVITHFGR